MAKEDGQQLYLVPINRARRQGPRRIVLEGETFRPGDEGYFTGEPKSENRGSENSSRSYKTRPENPHTATSDVPYNAAASLISAVAEMIAEIALKQARLDMVVTKAVRDIGAHKTRIENIETQLGSISDKIDHLQATLPSRPTSQQLQKYHEDRLAAAYAKVEATRSAAANATHAEYLAAKDSHTIIGEVHTDGGVTRTKRIGWFG